MKKMRNIIVLMLVALIGSLLAGCSGGDKFQEYSLNIIVDNGIVLQSPDQETYQTGTEVILTAEANTGYIFDHWEGDLTGSNNPETVVINGNLNIYAIFVEDGVNYTLTVTAENGTVTKDPDLQHYPEGTEVTLTAEPAEGYVFSGWSGDASGTQSPLTLTVDYDLEITANFQVAESWTYIDTGISGNFYSQKVTVSPNGDLFLTYLDNADYVYVLKVPAGSTEAQNLGQVCGGNYGHATLVVDSQGQPVVVGYDLASGHNVVKRWNGTSWDDLNLAASVAGETDAAVYMDVTLDHQDNIYIALGVRVYFDDIIVVYKYENVSATWSEIEVPLFDQVESAGTMSIVCDSTGNLYLGYGMENGNDEPAIAKWDGTSWTTIGQAPFMTGNLKNPELAFDSSDHLYATVTNDYLDTHKIFAYDGTTLAELPAQPTVSADTNHLSFYVDSLDNKYAFFIDKPAYPNPDTLYVEQWNGASWAPVFSFAATDDGPIAGSDLLWVENGKIYHAYNISVWNGVSFDKMIKIRVNTF